MYSFIVNLVHCCCRSKLTNSIAIYSEMREGLLADETEFATCKVKGQLKSEH